MPKGQYPNEHRARGTRLPLRDRFWTKVNKDGPIVRPELGPCWIWTGAIFTWGAGYGQLQLEGRPHPAHRVSWYIAHDEWPDKDLAHRCDNPPCVRIDHLFEATPLENNRDMIAKGRNSRNGKLTDKQCREIRERVAFGPRGTARLLSAEFGVSEGMISLIVHEQRRTQTLDE
jgi:hypothetical protein